MRRIQSRFILPGHNWFRISPIALLFFNGGLLTCDLRRRALARPEQGCTNFEVSKE